MLTADEWVRIEIATLAAKTFGQVIVLKGHRTVVTDGDRVYVNRTGDSSLSKAGIGDVLSGIIGTLLAQQMDRFDADCAGVWINGRAGEIADGSWAAESVLARDVIDSLPEAIAAYGVAGVARASCPVLVDSRAESQYRPGLWAR